MELKHVLLLTGITGVVLLGVGSVLITSATSDTVRQNAEQQAREYANTMYPGESPVNVSCQALDTDNNGYVTCSLRVAQHPILPIECSAYISINLNNGCKPLRFAMQPNQ